MPKLNLSVGDGLGKSVLERGWIESDVVDEATATKELKALNRSLGFSSGIVTEVKNDYFKGLFRKSNGTFVRISFNRT